ncbi:MAG: hypothetical protein ABL907_05960 [Hyphomicrobium sp.]
MISLKTLTPVLLAAAVTMVGFAGDADAHKRNYKHKHSSGAYCHARMEGRATGQGLFGMGTANARSAAVSDWADKVNARWGINYANFANARGVRWDCKKGAILQAKCVVIASPCR